MIQKYVREIRRVVLPCAHSVAAFVAPHRKPAKRQLLLFALVLFLYSCKHRENTVAGEHGKVVVAAVGFHSAADTLRPPHVTRMDTCAPPVSVTVPHAAGVLPVRVGKENVKLQLRPPVIRPADFYAPMTTFTSDQGLYGFISAIYCDHKGALWFGTDGGGAIRYDGKSFTNYTTAHGLESNTVRSITEDKKGNIWFGTDGGGVSCFNGRSFVNYKTADGLGNNNVWAVLTDRNGNLWFGTDGGGVSCFDGKSFTTYNTAKGLAGNRVRCLAEDSKGNIWCGTAEAGVSRFDGHSFTNFGRNDGLASNAIYCIFNDRQGLLWFGTRDKGASYYDGKVFKSYDTATGLVSNTIRCIGEDGKGNIWFGTEGGGLSSFNGHGFATYSTAQGLCNNTVLSLAMDHSGSMWFGTNGGGASRYDGSVVTTYTTAQGLCSNQIYGIAQGQGDELWFGSAVAGVSRYDGRSFTTYSTAQGLLNAQVVSIAKDRKGILWLGTYGGGVSRFDGKSFTTYTTAQGLGSNNVMCLAVDSSNRLWLGTDGGGVSMFDGGGFTTFTTLQGLCNNSVLSICADYAGRLWFGTNGGGLSSWDGRTFTTYNTAHGLSNNKIYCIVTDARGNLWMGTDGGGICRYDGHSFVSYTTADGLNNNVVFGITTTAEGEVWLGTNEGFCGLAGFRRQGGDARGRLVAATDSIDNRTLAGQFAPVFETYNFKTGYPVKDINENALFTDTSGKIWAGTSDKLVRFDPSAIKRSSGAPGVFISAVKIDNENICWNDLLLNRPGAVKKTAASADSMAAVTEEISLYGNVLSPASRDTLIRKFGDARFDSISPFYPVPQGLVLPYSCNNVTIEFGAVETARPGLVNYQYMLEGYDKEWSPAGNKTSASFGNIPEGTFTFRLKAQGPGGVWSQPVEYTFKVEPPVYRTAWAILVYVVSLILAVFGIIRLRTSQLQKEKEKLEQIVEDRTAEIVKEKAEAEKQRQLSDTLLLNILPEEVALELKETGSAKVKHFENVTVLFTDFVNFTKTAEQMTPEELISELHTCFTYFDEVIERYHLEKIKTIGDAYLAVCGLPQPDLHHAEHVVNAAIEINNFMTGRYRELGHKTFRIRLGIHTGSVIAGIVGMRKFAYDIWGDSVNTAARMEQSSASGRINISQSTYDLVKDTFNCSYRGDIEAKNKGKLSMYFVDDTEPVKTD